MLHYTLQAVHSANESLLRELANEQFIDLDQARDVALSLVHEYGVDIQVLECFAVSEHVREVYDAATYA